MRAARLLTVSYHALRRCVCVCVCVSQHLLGRGVSAQGECTCLGVSAQWGVPTQVGAAVPVTLIEFFTR